MPYVMLVISFWLVCIWGWVANIAHLYNHPFTASGQDILRAIGVFVAPLGAMLGYF